MGFFESKEKNIDSIEFNTKEYEVSDEEAKQFDKFIADGILKKTIRKRKPLKDIMPIGNLQTLYQNWGGGDVVHSPEGSKKLESRNIIITCCMKANPMTFYIPTLGVLPSGVTDYRIDFAIHKFNFNTYSSAQCWNRIIIKPETSLGGLSTCVNMSMFDTDGNIANATNFIQIMPYSTELQNDQSNSYYFSVDNTNKPDSLQWMFITLTTSRKLILKFMDNAGNNIEIPVNAKIFCEIIYRCYNDRI